MKLRKTLGGLALTAALTVGGVATAFAGGDGGTSTTTGQTRQELVCQHLPQIKEHMQQRKQRLQERLTKLRAARQKAVDAKKPALVVRIDKRSTHVVATISHIDQREAKLAAWAAKHC